MERNPGFSPAKQRRWVVKYNDNYYFDPGIPAVQQLVVGAVRLRSSRITTWTAYILDDYFYRVQILPMKRLTSATVKFQQDR